MKIGILTFHNAYNFGAFLQCYALQFFLEEKGHQASVINYHNKYIDYQYKQFVRRRFPLRHPIGICRQIIIAIYRILKFYEFSKYSNKCLKLTNLVNDKNSNTFREFDLIIVGSDQLWNSRITDGFDDIYWGEFSHYTRANVITYAVCANMDCISENDISFIKKHLSNFNSISVRENMMKESLKTLTDNHINVSVDPTLLVKKDFWYKNLKKNHFDYKYVCVYAILDKEQVISEAKKFAEEHHLKLVIMQPIADASPFCNYYQPSCPFDFMSIIANAEYIFTSSFHGMTFSIIFNKLFYVFGDRGKNQRMKSLLKNLGIEERFINENLSYPENDINYKEVEERLHLMRTESETYLNQFLN